jgi:hypothetical protein
MRGQTAALSWSEGVCAASAALAAALGVETTIGEAGESIALRSFRDPGQARSFAPFMALILLCAATVLATILGAAAFRIARRRRRPWLAALASLALVAVAGAFRARWLVFGAPLAALAVSPWIFPGRIASHERQRPSHEPIVCIASEAACLGVGLWLPSARTAPALLLWSMGVPAAAAAALALRFLSREARWRWATAGVPLCALPLVGLMRNPSRAPALLCIALSGAAAWASSRWQQGENRSNSAAAFVPRALGWAKQPAAVAAWAGAVLFLVLPWGFRDLPSADNAGHEGQHLGWINSISFGKFMMADAGFTYGPAREYLLAAAAVAQGGLTLEHVRLAHVLVNVVGLVCAVAALHRVAAGRPGWMLVGVSVLLLHSPLVCFVVYSSTYSFGWADASRAGLAILPLVSVLARDRTRALEWDGSIVAAGATAALATLYSIDFGVPGVFATLVGVAFEAAFGPRETAPPPRLRAALRTLRAYAVGLSAVLVPFVAVYAAFGKLGGLAEGFRWTLAIARGLLPATQLPQAVSSATFGSFESLVAPASTGEALGTRMLDYVLPPAVGVLGLCHVGAALVRRGVHGRTALIAGLAVLTLIVQRPAQLTVDPWHMVNATSPAVVLLVALAAGGEGLWIPTGRRRAFRAGSFVAAIVPIVWLVHGGQVPIQTRLARLASGAECPSFGRPYSYPGVPRAGDVRVTAQHLDSVRAIQKYSKTGDPVLSTTWLIGGGTEAFLSDRRNPTSFDKPDEVLTPEQRQQALRELRRDPPVLIVGNFFEFLGDDARSFIAAGWHPLAERTPAPILIRNDR